MPDLPDHLRRPCYYSNIGSSPVQKCQKTERLRQKQNYSKPISIRYPLTMQNASKVEETQDTYTVSCQTPPPPHLLVANTPSVSIGSAPQGHWIATNSSKSVTGQEKLSVRLNCETSMFSSRGGHGGSEHDNGKNCSDCTKWSHL